MVRGFMDDKGLILTFDSVMALIPVFIILLAVAGVNQGQLILPSQQVRLNHQAQDSLDLMAQYRNPSGETVLAQITYILESNNNSAPAVEAAGEITSEFMEKIMPGMEYKLVELNQLGGAIIASRGEMDGAENVAVGWRSYRNYLYQLYVW